MKHKKGNSVFKIEKESRPKKECDINDMLRRRTNAKQEQTQWQYLLKKAYHYAVPNYNPWENYDTGVITPGQIYDTDVYDLTLMIAHQKLLNKMLIGMVPVGEQWVKFKPGDKFGSPDSSEYKQALEATQKLTDAFFKILDRSNFYLAVGEAFSDVLISTGFLTINEGTKSNPLVFEAVPSSHVMLEGDPLGGFSAIFRDWMNVRVDQIKMIWADAKTPSGKESSAKVNIYECCYVDYDAPESERYRYAVITSNREKLYESSSPSWPWVVFRMKKLAGEYRGRGPTLDATPAAATITEAVGDELMAAAFIGNPMYMAASDSAFNSDSFVAKPGAIIPVQMIMGQYPIQAFPSSGNIQFTALLVNEFRQQINDLLYIAPLGPINSPDRTATESQIRYRENLESFAAMIPRLQSEFFDQVIKRSMFLINKASPEVFEGVPKEIKDKLISVDGEILDLSYETPLMTARGQLKVSKFMEYFQTLAGVIGPEGAAASLNAEKVPQFLADNIGSEMSLIKSPEDIKMLIDKGAEELVNAEEPGQVINEQ